MTTTSRPQHDEELADGAYFVGRLEWSGSMVDVYPVGDHTVGEMVESDLSGPIRDIYDANDSSRFSDGEHLGFVYYSTPEEYDLRVA